MAKMMTQLELLTKHVIGAPTKMVNVAASKGFDEEEVKRLDEEIQYLANYLVGSHPSCQRKGGN